MSSPAPSPLPAAPSLGDAEVVARVRAGEVALFEVLMRRHNAKVWRAVRSVLRDEGEAEDAMQQAWISAYRHLAAFAGEAAFGTWVVRIALNTARSRARRRPELVTDAGDSGPSDPVTPERRAAAREAVALVEAAVDGLSPALREVYMLREVEGLSTADAARALELDEGAVKVRLHRARAAMRERLEGLIGEAASGAFGFMGARCDMMVTRVLGALR